MQHADRFELIRFVKTKSGEVVVDREQKIEGRGVYVHDDPACIAKMKKKKLLAAALKTSVKAEVYDI